MAQNRKSPYCTSAIGRFARYLISKGCADQKTLDGVAESVKAEIETAVTKAMADPEPRPEDALEDMFV